MSTLVVLALAVALIVARRRARRRRLDSAPRPAARRRALLVVFAIVGMQAVFGAPAMAQTSSCAQAPNPERPGAGMVGVLDPALPGTGQPGSVYDEFGYAGLVWHTYDLGCGPEGITSPNATIDTWVGNQLFNVSKNIVAATNGLHNLLVKGESMWPLDELVKNGTVALYDSVYTPLFGLLALLLAVFLFRYIWKGDLAAIGKRGLWALAGVWLAAATYLTPLIYTEALDGILIAGTTQVQAGFLREVGIGANNAVPTVLHDQVVFQNWKRGEFGAADAPEAEQYARPLLAAQSWTKQDRIAGLDRGSPDPKKAAFKEIATKLGSAYGYFQGVDGSRMGAGFLSLLQAICFSLFQLLAKLAILMGQVLLRVAILAGPLIGLIAMINHNILRNIGRAVGATLLNVIVIAALAGLHTMVLVWIFNPGRGLSMLAQIALAGLVTLVLFLVGKPLRRMWQMVELSVGAVGSTLPASPPGFLSRFRGRRAGQRTPQDDFWDEVRGMDPDQNVEGRRKGYRDRPEAAYAGGRGARGSLAATVQGTVVGADGRVLPAVAQRLHEAGGGALGANRAALPAARSRIVDTASVFDRSWDRTGEDAVVVPSRLDASPSAMSTGSMSSSRRSDMETVAGRPVWVVYRPSRGLELRDGESR
ncbi:hypothetical protein NLX83_18060 [Allokutzneria sp. A3M-2-11 16]|uniref:hypothetical protein n=1 Tax=Allokutzneria sp. A3M-2-11 16 TaxID=2962043 RepID=UPI0020B8BC6A|nr:hypothetical protein [Allokutzneria sp. A3M-2-11 16]MCP3801168.1 hypothetical protein [Allokutzneria sp. A3M-2-11 16]